tara:strand:- start:349 stop:453 length:105 start_codon:yes stop_codon:yes gene_type:complete
LSTLYYKKAKPGKSAIEAATEALEELKKIEDRKK